MQEEHEMSETKKLTGYPSIDKPWLKYYSDVAVNSPLPECSLYEYMYTNNIGNKKRCALSYFGQDITFNTLFRCIDEVAKAFIAQGVKKGDNPYIVDFTFVDKNGFSKL